MFASTSAAQPLDACVNSMPDRAVALSVFVHSCSWVAAWPAFVVVTPITRRAFFLRCVTPTYLCIFWKPDDLPASGTAVTDRILALEELGPGPCSTWCTDAHAILPAIPAHITKPVYNSLIHIPNPVTDRTGHDAMTLRKNPECLIWPRFPAVHVARNHVPDGLVFIEGSPRAGGDYAVTACTEQRLSGGYGRIDERVRARLTTILVDERASGRSGQR